jgi:hypothetical protein
MSFVGLGDLSASPAVTATGSGTFNFDPFGLVNYSLNPSVNVSGGFTNFAMTNLNRSEFMTRLRKPVPADLVNHFHHLDWPDELVDLMLVRSVTLTQGQYSALLQRTKEMCDLGSTDRTVQICLQLKEDQLEFETEGCQIMLEPEPTVTFLNTAREFCSMKKFQILLRIIRLQRFSSEKILPRADTRSPQDILYYLGELIAAQNYSTHPYCPMLYVGTPDGRRRLVPLFIVRRGGPVPGPAAVRVFYNGEMFYIPLPALGSLDEARSLQVLDFVSQVIAAVTISKDIPKSSTATLVLAR